MSATVQAALRVGVVRLTEAGISGAAGDARRLMAAALDLGPDRLVVVARDAIAAGPRARFERMIAARASSQPIAQILGHRLFWGRAFEVTGEVLDPRPETEALIDLALKGPVPRRVLDLGTGSGALIVTLLAEWPDATGVATDQSKPALDVASRNAARHGVGARVAFLRANWMAGVPGTFDLVVCNPPYLAHHEIAALDRDVREWEPRGALTPGPEGLESYRQIAAELPRALCPGGRAFFEIGPAQDRAVAAIFTDAGLIEVSVHPDLDGRARIVSMSASGAHGG